MPARSELNTSRRPSGENDGEVSIAASVVSRRCVVGLKVENVDVGIAALGQRHGHEAAIGGEVRGEGHAGKIAELLLASASQIEQVNLRHPASVDHERHLPRIRGKAWSQDQVGAVGQKAVIGAVLVHDGEALDPIGRGAAFGDVDDAGIEIATLAGNALVDGIGNLVSDPTPVVVGRRKAQATHLNPGEHVPEAEFDVQVAIGALVDVAGDQGLGVDLTPVGEARQVAQLLGRLDEGTPIDRPEQSRAFQIRADHVRDIPTALLGGRRGTVELADGNRQRLDDTLGDVQLEHRLGRQRRHDQRQQNPPSELAERGCKGKSAHQPLIASWG